MGPYIFELLHGATQRRANTQKFPGSRLTVPQNLCVPVLFLSRPFPARLPRSPHGPLLSPQGPLSSQWRARFSPRATLVAWAWAGACLSPCSLPQADKAEFTSVPRRRQDPLN